MSISSKIGPLRPVLIPGLLVTLIFVVIVTFSFVPSADSSTTAESVDIKSPAHQAALAKHARNSSLGFGEIVYISMPDRSDRQDAMHLLASFYDLKLTLVPGVNGSEVNIKAIPDEMPADARPSVLGCWRAHANAWRYLLESDMDTLLVFEDDLDWNPNLRNTLETLSLQMQNSKLRVTEPSDYERQTAPYGLDWDVLYLGSFRHGGNPDFKDFVQIWDDPDVPDKSRLNKGRYSNTQALQDFGLTEEEIGTKRALAPSYWTMHTTAYAITRQGAQRLLFLMSYAGELHGDVDVEMTRLFRDGKLRGYSLTPPAFSQFKVGGTKDSDNIKAADGKSTDGKGNLHGLNNNIKGSARKKMVESLQLDNWNDYKRLKEQQSVATRKT
ncbi:hypothetical protein V1525DRAFT_393853 [Lipomyces kononenkoae]|uniref:Uncharacterized protein n=1 Tax=Lipomyces kononenkoae TaxID=34357 RepID=A0ACC3TB83_LIPKO